ncbi:THAP domain-containing protein 1-like [Dendronephthya gigantea]|uniref:THAP domain-containing protein 1-like n=1 Tax=Dendronephthya gigantea TaxID=151771 RepID=UPI001069D832|nr:THAP domain-containing protein 1-like [Dendronephthya gigantea]
MPHRCVVFGCSNTANLREGIALHRIPYANDMRPEAKKRRKTWVDFLRRKRERWEPSVHSEVCSKHFKEEDFVNRYIGVNEMPDADKPLLVAPRLKQDNIGICVFPSKYCETSSTLSARDRRRITLRAKQNRL